MQYVIDKNKKYVTHQGDGKSCVDYVRNARIGRRRVFIIVFSGGVKEANRVISVLKNGGTL